MADIKISFGHPTPTNGGTASSISAERLGRDYHFVRYALFFVIGYPTPVTLTPSGAADSREPSESISSAGQEVQTISRIPPMLTSHTHGHHLAMSPFLCSSALIYNSSSDPGCTDRRCLGRNGDGRPQQVAQQWHGMASEGINIQWLLLKRWNVGACGQPQM